MTIAAGMTDDGRMGLELVPNDIRATYTIEERHHACAILTADFPREFEDLLDCLSSFRLRRSHIVVGGKGKSKVSQSLDQFMLARGWAERSVSVTLTVENRTIQTRTHKIDCFKNSVGLEIEWNNKTEFYDRDLETFRTLHELKVLDVGIIITRLTELQKAVFNPLGIGKKYGASTTHWNKLIPKVQAGGAGGCPLLLVGIGVACYDPNA